MSVLTLNSNDETKHCCKCETTKSLTDFYKAGNAYQSLCKPCHNKSRMNTYKIRPTGFNKLPLDVRQNIIADLANGIKLSAIAIKYNIKYFNLSNWRRKNNLIIC